MLSFYIWLRYPTDDATCKGVRVSYDRCIKHGKYIHYYDYTRSHSRHGVESSGQFYPSSPGERRGCLLSRRLVDALPVSIKVWPCSHWRAMQARERQVPNFHQRDGIIMSRQVITQIIPRKYFVSTYSSRSKLSTTNTVSIQYLLTQSSLADGNGKQILVLTFRRRIGKKA